MNKRKDFALKSAAIAAPPAPELDLAPIIYSYCRCPQCDSLNSIVLKMPDIPATHKCCGCKEIIPTEAFLVVSYTNIPLPPINQSLNSEEVH